MSPGLFLPRTDGRVVTVVVLLVLISCEFSLSQATDDTCVCNQLSCDTPVNCTHGITSDPCGCCIVCARGTGDSCGGGPRGIGVCGEGLQCVIKAENGNVITGREEGICEKIGPGCDITVCDSYVTHRCPSDSVLVYNGTDQSNACCRTTYECQCDMALCKVPRCAAGHSPQILRHSNGKPGSCCDLYQCKISGCWSVDGKVYKKGEVWKEGDCVTCHCVEGKKQCQAEMCVKTCKDPVYVSGLCCPYCDAPRRYPDQPVDKCPNLSSCNITCEAGLQQTPDGCHVCKCKPEGCYKDCPYGYKFSETGKQQCECQVRPTECPDLLHCSKNCNHGYKLSKKGCPKCRCNKCQQIRCDNMCYHGYKTDKNGCQICKCIEPLWENNCTAGDTLYTPGQSWLGENCTICMCKRDGAVSCDLMSCPVLSCAFQFKKNGECCPVCLNVSVVESVPEKSTSKSNNSTEARKTEGKDLQEMEAKYTISLAIVGSFVAILLILVFVLLYLKLKQKHQASWTVAGQDSYCKCPLFIGHSPLLQHKYNGEIPNKLGYETVVVQKFNHPCITASIPQDSEEKKSFLSDEEREKNNVDAENNLNRKSKYSYNGDWSSM